MSKDCGKVHKLSNELNKHVLKHSGMVWECGVGDCEYTTDDRRNLCAHKRSIWLSVNLNVNHVQSFKVLYAVKMSQDEA